MPPAAIKVFHSCSLHWWASGCVPSQFLCARQRNILKPNKIKDGTTKVEDLRPIAVMSCFYRIFSSAWVRNAQTQTWIVANLHPNVSYGRNSPGADLLAQNLQDHYAVHAGCIASLDWKQAFDHISPKISTEMMKLLNFNPQLAAILSQVWGGQQRHLEFEGHVFPQKLNASKALPQGDPISPLILSLWVCSGLNHVESDPEVLTSGPAVTLCYMDDRSFWTKAPEGILARIRAWNQWSADHGLLESDSKTQIVAKDSRHKAVFAESCPGWLKEDATILGVCTVSSRRQASQKELDRIRAAQKRASLLMFAPLNWTLKVRGYQSLVISKAASTVGSVTLLPSKLLTNSLLLSVVSFLRGKGRLGSFANFGMGQSPGCPSFSRLVVGLACFVRSASTSSRSNGVAPPSTPSPSSVATCGTWGLLKSALGSGHLTTP